MDSGIICCILIYCESSVNIKSLSNTENGLRLWRWNRWVELKGGYFHTFIFLCLLLSTEMGNIWEEIRWFSASSTVWEASKLEGGWRGRGKLARVERIGIRDFWVINGVVWWKWTHFGVLCKVERVYYTQIHLEF